MGNEEVFNQFSKLEEKIDLLINKCAELEKENSELLEKNFDLEAKLELKEEAEAVTFKESESLRSKIDTVLEKIAAYESNDAVAVD